MKLTICFLLLCAVYVEAAFNSSNTADSALQNFSADRIFAHGLEIVMNKLEQIERKLSKIQIQLTEYREEVKQNRDCVTSAAAAAAAQQESTTPITTTTTKLATPYSSCRNVPSKESGVYLITVNNASYHTNVYCEQEKFGGGWMVVQHRFDGSVDFYRNWIEYRDGFGTLDNEFWLGLERIHQFTTFRTCELIVEMKDFEAAEFSNSC
ncbi:angiopoietin-2-like [Anopheles albimanus]|uniref:angiopoietin-2-like n=1 Tax=Anopheles albimanus TaxID=7167 RepID=UPI001640CC19|nr:angiopoietin-2-like [Anopheles albimanus]